MAKSIILGVCATAMIPFPVAEAVATKEIKTSLPPTIELNNNWTKSCSLDYKPNKCKPLGSPKPSGSQVYSKLWLNNITRVLLSGSMFGGCQTNFKLQPSFNLKLASEFGNTLNKSDKLGCILAWQNLSKSFPENQSHQKISSLKSLSKSDRFIKSNQQKVAAKNSYQFPKLSRSSLMVSYPKTNSTFKPKKTKLANPAPKTKRIASPFGWRRRPYSYQLQFHQGIDYGAPLGSPVVAVGNGIVTRVVSGCYDFGNLFCGGQLGNWIEVDHGNGKLGIYGHLKNNSIVVKEGMKVRRNQEIAQVGSSGWSTGAHLDFRFKVNGKYEDPALYVTVPSF